MQSPGESSLVIRTREREEGKRLSDNRTQGVENSEIERENERIALKVVREKVM